MEVCFFYFIYYFYKRILTKYIYKMGNVPVKKTPEKKTFELMTATANKFNEFIDAGSLMIPDNYSAGNSLKIAGMLLSGAKDKNGKLAIETCSEVSIGNALLEMVTKGLNPTKHCDFIAYGGVLVCDENYQGKVMRGKRDCEIKNIVAQSVRDKEVFSYSVNKGIVTITKHEQSLSTRSNKVVGAYAVITFNDGTHQSTVMDINEIEKSWRQRPGGKLSPAHEKFPDQMAEKTVKKRALKPILESSSDSSLFHGESVKDKPLEDIKQEVKESNEDVQEVEFEEVVEEKQEPIKVETEKINQEAKAATSEEIDADPF